MALLDGLLGNASEIDSRKLQSEFEKVLAAGEQIEKAYQLIRDLVVFTDKRLIMVDKQGLTGSKVEYHSLPYRAITHFSIESGGHFDLDAELKIWVSGTSIRSRRRSTNVSASTRFSRCLLRTSSDRP